MGVKRNFPFRAPGGADATGVRLAASTIAGVAALCAVALAAPLTGCATQGLRPAVSMQMAVTEGTPKSALVYIDEQYIGTLGYVARRGVRLPEGEHRISIEKAGYFPYDVLVVSDREPIHLDVRLVKLPE
jgi:hypothetical protein